jgi:hypothetical protein
MLRCDVGREPWPSTRSACAAVEVGVVFGVRPAGSQLGNFASAIEAATAPPARRNFLRVSGVLRTSLP